MRMQQWQQAQHQLAQQAHSQQQQQQHEEARLQEQQRHDERQRQEELQRMQMQQRLAQQQSAAQGMSESHTQRLSMLQVQFGRRTANSVPVGLGSADYAPCETCSVGTTMG